MKAKKGTTVLHNPNDLSHGQCFAPVEKGHVNESKKKHIKARDDAPKGWVQVPCSKNCR